MTVRPDGSLYSSHRVTAPDAQPGDPKLPTWAALKLHGKLTARDQTRRARLAKMLQRKGQR